MALKNGNPDHKLTAEEQRQGGQKSGQVRREKKTFQELAKTLLSLDVKSGKSYAVMQQMGIESDDMQYKTLCVLGLMKAAQNGNVNAFEKLQELTGENGTSRNNGILDELAEYMKNDRDVKR